VRSHTGDRIFPNSIYFSLTINKTNPIRKSSPSCGRFRTHTLAAGIQLIQPGEIVWPHRHSATTLRFVIDGDPELVTVVGGTEYPMEDYDLILTPKWSWHHDVNLSPESEALLFSIDDGPMLAAFDLNREQVTGD